MTGSLDSALVERLLAEASSAASSAYAPYSPYKVGAALVTVDGSIVSGCNVENASLGLTICAERNAVFSAVSRFGPSLQVKALAVVLADGKPISPCGACRQVIAEFNPDAIVIYRSREGVEQTPIVELLPGTFAFGG